ncbi:PAS domain S-box protein [Pseudodesulfovibrio cashew]|nr:PAS domain S-box protein [Pseudodesulfovibrio cashew]
MFLLLPAEVQGYGSRHVLILHSYHSGMSWVDNLEKGIRDELLLPPNDEVIVHTEYMDTKRNRGQEFYDRLIRIYKEKYRNVDLDLILATDNNAFDFLLKHRDELFKGAPVVFGGVNNFTDDSITDITDFTGVAEIISFGETVETILRQFPDTKEIYVVNDYLKTGRAWHDSILKAQKPYEDKVKFTHNENLSIRALREKVLSMQPGSVVLLGVYYEDRNGEYLTYEKLGSQLTKDSPVPVYCLVRFNLRDNAIGGKLISGYHHGRQMSRLGRRILAGEKASDIPVVKIGGNAFIFNWLGMNKFGVSMEELPPDSVVINEPYSFYREYFALIWTGIALITVLFLLVVILSSTVLKLRRTRRELTYSERKYRSIFDNAAEGIFQSSLDGKILSANKSLAKMFGYDSPEDFETAVTDIKDDLYANSSERDEIMGMILQGKRITGHHVQMKHKKGWKLWASVNFRQATTQDGTVIVEGSLIDITERKLAEEELLRIRKYLANIIDSMPSLLVGVDLEGRITLMNRTAEKSTNIATMQAMGKNVVEILPWLAPYMSTIKDSIVEHVPWQTSKVPRHENGETRYENITVFPLSSDISKEAVIRIDNVSRSVQMERMMVQSEKMMSVGGLAAGMAHEINNPLAAVIGYAHNIKKRISAEGNKNRRVAEDCGVSLEAVCDYLRRRDVPTMLDGISESGERAARIVSNMLDFSRKNESTGTGSHNAAELLDEALKLATNVYDMQRQFDFRRIQVVREYESDLPDVTCDGNEITQVFLNLLKNGAEAMAEKEYGDDSPTFILRARTDNDLVLIEIEDNGPGMPEHVRRRVMEPFFTTKPVGRGTGLGLSVSYFIVTDLHKGSMEVRSEEGQWTRFIIGLPIQREDAA